MSDAKASVSGEASPCECSDENKIVITERELQGFCIVRAILYNKVDNIDRVVHRDTQSYFGILLDDNNRKPICRLYFNSGNKYIETVDESKKGTKQVQEWIERFISRFDRLDGNLENISGKYNFRGERFRDNQGVCQLLHVSKRALQRYRSSGELPYQTIYHKPITGKAT